MGNLNCCFAVLLTLAILYFSEIIPQNIRCYVLRKLAVPSAFTITWLVRLVYPLVWVSQALNLPQTVQFSRIPVYGNSIDDIVGKVIKLDLFEAERKGKGDAPVSQFSKPIVRVSEKLPVHVLLEMFIGNRGHLFLVEDEFGQTAGIVTLEDAIVTLLGREIVDESDKVEDMQALARGKYRDRLRSSRLKKDEQEK